MAFCPPRAKPRLKTWPECWPKLWNREQWWRSSANWVRKNPARPGRVRGLGVDRREIASPTFVLIHEYQGRLPIFHFDIYRLRQASDLLDLGADEYLNSNGICFIEWADRVAGLLPPDHLRIEIVAIGETTREFCFSATGPKAQRLVEHVKRISPAEATYFSQWHK